ncbi:MAG TPA: DUF5916 domain-containing protein [Gemmatimonadaceae bacterium]|nr:DUF5916 domain-containing protein [Gemmatimonadaceae bacterium]
MPLSALRVVAVAGLLFASSLEAQRITQQSSVHGPDVPTTPAVRRDVAVVVDGKLDEAAWARATPVTRFRQSRPTEGAPASLATEVRFLFDDQALYVGARMAEPLGAAGIRAPLARRDQLLAANGNNGSFNSLTTDKLAIALDPYLNHLDEVLFEVNPAGVKGDQLNGDPSWDPVWDAATQVTADGWTAEMRIPYSQLRFGRDSVQTWGLQVRRYVDRLNELAMWSFRRNDEAGGPAYYGHLEGLAITRQPRQLELLPYVVSGAQYKYVDPRNPYRETRDMRLNVGADVKYNLTSNLTLDATFNPDFGQVEVDPAVLNLSAYEVFYDEKRPFFVANSGAFGFGGASCMFCSNFSGPGVFYSRRIGRPPQLNGYVSGSSAFADAPEDATILGAAKITGRTSNGYTLGILNAVASRETARFRTSPDAIESAQVVEPLTNYFVGRVRKDLRAGATQVGVIATSTLRALDGDSLLESALRSRATVGGLDWSHAWSRRRYRWRGALVASDVRGSEQALLATQLSSTHFYQRTDRAAALLDSSATSMQGWGLYTRLAKENGNWLWEIMENVRSPGYETNDLSILDRTDYAQTTANLAYSWTTPTRWYRSMYALVGGIYQRNWDGVTTDFQRQAYYQIEFPNFWRIRSFVIRDATTDDDRLTRGGPTVKVSGYDFGHFQVSTDPRRFAVFDVQLRGTRGFDDTRAFNVRPGVAVKPASNVFVQFSPSYNYSENATQYLRRQADPTATAFGGTRYLFGHVTTRTVSLETRVNWTMRPTVALQMYVQPFFASGDYASIREFAAPRSEALREYGRDIGTVSRDTSARRYTLDPDGTGPAAAFSFNDPNFTNRSLRGTAVLRWEYRPGSTLFFVWTQQRAGSSGHGDYDFGRDSRALLGDRPDNVFLVKATYWLGR